MPGTSLERRYDILFQTLLARISQGEWCVGTRLPTEVELARTYGVSRTTVTKAIAKLQSMGLIRSRQGDGTYVESTIPRASVLFVSAVLAAPPMLRQLLEFRRLLETEIGRLAVERASDAQLDALDAALLRMRATKGDPQAFVAADVAFHLTLAEAAGNQILIEVYQRAQDLLQQQMLLGSRRTGAAERAIAAHARIVRGLRLRSADRVVAAIVVHLDDAADELDDALHSAPPAEDAPSPADGGEGAEVRAR